MMSFHPISNGSFWKGSSWSIDDEDELAILIARVALGQYRHVMKILHETECTAYAPASSALQGAIDLLTAKNDKDPYHRDGWLFQVISWIAAHLQNPDTLKSPPHMIHAGKGFDGLHVCLDSTNTNVVSVIICEEKATEGPRGKITSQVWPEFQLMETGERDHELVAEITTILATNGHIDPEKAVHQILWEQARAYRVSITVGNDENSKSGRKALFKGYKNKVTAGSVDRRRVETLCKNDLRDWMQHIADKAITVAKEMEACNV